MAMITLNKADRFPPRFGSKTPSDGSSVACSCRKKIVQRRRQQCLE